MASSSVVHDWMEFVLAAPPNTICIYQFYFHILSAKYSDSCFEIAPSIKLLCGRARVNFAHRSRISFPECCCFPLPHCCMQINPLPPAPTLKTQLT